MAFELNSSHVYALVSMGNLHLSHVMQVGIVKSVFQCTIERSAGLSICNFVTTDFCADETMA
jgi:hypothetical protein